MGGGQKRKAVQACAKKLFGPMWNLFGAHDIRGRGSNNPKALHCDPFILAHAGTIPKGMKPPFCAHPHCGTSVGSLLFQGGTISPWDNLHGTEEDVLLPGGIYHVDSGAGCVHDEPFDIVSLSRTRASFDPDTAAQGVNVEDDAPAIFMQLWWNSLDTSHSDSELRPCTTQVLQPKNVPLIVHEGGIQVRVLAGDYNGCGDPLAPSSSHPVTLLHVNVDAGAQGALLPISPHYNGFVWHVRGGCICA